MDRSTSSVTSLATSGRNYLHISRSPTARPRTNASSLWGLHDQRIVCAIGESRGVSPTVGLAFVNLSTGEAVLSQLCDSQTYVRTIHKLSVFDPNQILVVNTALRPKSKLCAIIEESLPGTEIIGLDRKYWAETTGLEYIQHLAFAEDVEPIKASLGGNYFATCCIAAVRCTVFICSISLGHDVLSDYRRSSMLSWLGTSHSLPDPFALPFSLLRGR